MTRSHVFVRIVGMFFCDGYLDEKMFGSMFIDPIQLRNKVRVIRVLGVN